jgi:hypothetical protein
MHVRDRKPLQVLITVDTEAWPYREGWRDEQLAGDIQRDVYGATPEGEFGLEFQCGMLRDHGLKAVFFVETLFASVVGLQPLRRIVETVRSYEGQTVELHAHPEWTRHFPPPGILAGQRYQHFSQLAVEQQIALLGVACKNLRDSGVAQIRGFRAGNYGANLDTCRALAAVGIPFDFSYDAAFPAGCCMLPLAARLCQPAPLEGVIEVPTSVFEDYPGHIRHAQLCGSSFAEMRRALNQAWRLGWSHFVILSHSFELIKRSRRADCLGHLNPMALSRMESLCRFLKAENDRFETIGCESLEEVQFSRHAAGSPLRGSWWNTAVRCAEQAWGRLSR